MFKLALFSSSFVIANAMIGEMVSSMRAPENEFVGYVETNYMGVMSDLESIAATACESATLGQHKRMLLEGEHTFSILADRTFFSFKCPSLGVVDMFPPGIVVEPNGIMTTQAAPPSWGLDRIDQEDLPLNREAIKRSHTGLGVLVYVIDTGLNSLHREFTGRAVLGGDFVNEDDMNDMNGHGTHCSGVATGTTYGIAIDATIIGVKVLNAGGSGSYDNVIKGINWAISNASGVSSVFSLSLGGGKSSTVDAAVRRASDQGHIVVVAAGNDNKDACGYSPAGTGGTAESGGVISVMSSTSTDSLSSFSNWGTCTDIIAPGSSITSAWKSTVGGSNTISGTSMATPHVAGVAALLLEKHNFNKELAQTELLALRVASKISGNFHDGPNGLLQVPTYTGQPTLPTQKPTFPPTLEPAKLCAGSQCTFDVALSKFGPAWPSLLTGVGAIVPSLLCNGEATGSINGKIALVSRGDCPFYDKVINAGKAGAIGVVFINTATQSLIQPNYYYEDKTLIPSMMIPYSAGQTLRTLWTSETVGYGQFQTFAPTPPTTAQPSTLRPTTSIPTGRPSTGYPSTKPTTGRPTKSPTQFPTSRPSTARPSKSPTRFPTSRPTTARPTPFVPETVEQADEFLFCSRLNFNNCKKQAEKCRYNKSKVRRRWVVVNAAFPANKCLPLFLTDL